MKVVVSPFLRFSSLLVSNVYLLDGGPGDRWLIDSGHPTERWQLTRELRSTGLRPSDLTGVLLTHRHSDHAGNAAWLQREFGVKIYAHRADADVLAGRAPRVPLGTKGTWLERALGHVENRFPARLAVDGVLDDGDTVASPEVHLIPGHTEGSVLYRHARTSCLLTGDTILSARPPLTLVRDILPPYEAFSLDAAQAHAALDAFHTAGWAYEHVLSGHGKPIVGGARAKVVRALAGSQRRAG